MSFEKQSEEKLSEEMKSLWRNEEETKQKHEESATEDKRQWKQQKSYSWRETLSV